MRAPTSNPTLLTVFWMFTLSTAAAATGYWGLDSSRLLSRCTATDTDGAPLRALEFSTPIVHPDRTGLRVSRLGNLSRCGGDVRPASVPQTLTDPEGEQLVQALVNGFQDRIDAIDGRLEDEVGVGLDVVFDVLHAQLQIAIFGADDLPSPSPDEDPDAWTAAAVDAAVVFAIDAHGQMLQARGALHELLEQARCDPLSTVSEIEVEGHPVCAIEQGDDQLLLTWLGPLLVGAVGPDALTAAILSFETAAPRKRDREFI